MFCTNLCAIGAFYLECGNQNANYLFVANNPTQQKRSELK